MTIPNFKERYDSGEKKREWKT